MAHFGVRAGALLLVAAATIVVPATSAVAIELPGLDVAAPVLDPLGLGHIEDDVEAILDQAGVSPLPTDPPPALPEPPVVEPQPEPAPPEPERQPEPAPADSTASPTEPAPTPAPPAETTAEQLPAAPDVIQVGSASAYAADATSAASAPRDTARRAAPTGADAPGSPAPPAPAPIAGPAAPLPSPTTAFPDIPDAQASPAIPEVRDVRPSLVGTRRVRNAVAFTAFIAVGLTLAWYVRRRERWGNAGRG